jgi:hypothetical protein
LPTGGESKQPMAINLEMMKQLLAEFSEKEALTTEEIRAVQQQTKELEQRILQCQERLKLVSEDRVRINEMLGRYAGINGISGSSIPAPTAPPPVPKTERPPAPGPAPAVSKPAVVQPPPVPSVSAPPPPASSPAASPASFFEDMPPPPPPKAPEAPVPFASAHDLVSSLSAATESAPPPPAPAPEAPAAEGESDEHSDDTVKSINDALRGLFR